MCHCARIVITIEAKAIRGLATDQLNLATGLTFSMAIESWSQIEILSSDCLYPYPVIASGVHRADDSIVQSPLSLEEWKNISCM